MKIGFFLPQIGPAANVDSIVAKRAEELKYDSVWVTDRLLYPTNPQTSYYGGPLPDELILDPTFSPDTHTGQDFLRNMEEIRKML